MPSDLNSKQKEAAVDQTAASFFKEEVEFRKMDQ